MYLNSLYLVFNTFRMIFQAVLISPRIFQFSAIVTSVANLICLTMIIHIYWGQCREVKSKFTISLIILFLLFMVQNFLFTVYFLLYLPKSCIDAIGPLLFLGCEFIVLTLFFKWSPEWNQINLNLFNHGEIYLWHCNVIIISHNDIIGLFWGIDMLMDEHRMLF